MKKKAFRIAAAWALLGAILACGSTQDDNNDDSPPPPPGVQPPVVQPPGVPPNNVPPNNVPPNNVPQAPAAPFSLSTGFLPDPHTVNGQAGGPTSAGTLDPTCRGNVPAVPQHTVTFDTAFSALRIIARASGDTTLVVRMPDGTYRCDDDSESFNPIVDGSFPPGSYQIWVGTYQSGVNMPYVLGFTERPSVSAYDLPL